MRKFFLCLLSIAVSFFTQAQNNDLPQPAFLEMQAYPKVRDFTLSNSGEEAYFSIQSPNGEMSVISRIVKENNGWTAPQTALFSGKHHDMEPFLSPDNLSLYFASSRPKNNLSAESKD